jgi:AGZA family xanthine/uracil permease-like MFS transporter
MMVVTYSISNGIMLGAITYVIISLLTKRFTKKDIVILIIALLGILRFAFIAM